MGRGGLGADLWALGAPGRPPREFSGSLVLLSCSFRLPGVIDPGFDEFVIILTHRSPGTHRSFGYQTYGHPWALFALGFHQ